MSERGERIGTAPDVVSSTSTDEGARLGVVPKIRHLQTRRPCLVDAQRVLEVFVECVEQAVTKAPQEEQDRHKTDRHERLLEREFGRLGAIVVGHPQRALPPELLAERHGRLWAARDAAKCLGKGIDAVLRADDSRQ
jgi:hypothetical protein